jgi:hypothetical protein
MRNRHIYKIKPSNRSRLKMCETACVIYFFIFNKKLHVLLLHQILVLLLQLK